MNVTLIGMSGSGKSFLGRKVAEVRGLTFIDIDEELEKRIADIEAQMPEKARIVKEEMLF